MEASATTTDKIDKELSALLETLNPDDRVLVRKAFDFARKYHEGQTRVSGEPYITHTLAVARLLADLRLDAPTIAAGLLHDVVEDTSVEYEDLKREFSPQIADLVQGVTKLSKIHFDSGREHTGANLRKLTLAMAKDIRVVVIKLCDRLHNMRTLRHLPGDKRLAISRDTLAIYAPLAHRLGMTRIKTELEDRAMYWLYPDEYRSIQQAINKRSAERDSLIEEAKEFLLLYLRTNFPNTENIEIQGRSKHFFSIWQKMKSQGLSFEEIYDLNALRIICDDITQCYEILGLIHAIWPPLPNRFKDYIGMPKPNMYQSIHTTVIGLNGEITEIQIRTRRMHQVAEEGIAAHWRYKEGLGGSDRLNERLRWLRQLMDWITDLKEPSDFLDAMTSDVFSDVVVCFTPKGDLVELSPGATPLDFAYAIHTGVGEKCIGARVNRKQVTLNTKLNTGDVVEIQTSKAGHPSRDWLDIVASGRARSKIKRWLKEKEFDIWVAAGKDAVAHILKARSIDLPKEELYKKLETLVPKHRLSNVDDLFCEIGFGTISAMKALNQILPPREQKKRRALKPKTARPDEIVLEGGEGVPVRHASCCAPKPGDEIVGFVTRGRGVTVHKIVCPNMVRLRTRGGADTSRLLPAHWGYEEIDKYNPYVIRVQATDRVGLLNEISGLITVSGLFITGCNSRSNIKKGTAALNFQVRVRNTNVLEKVVENIREISNIIEVEAVEKNSRRQNGKE